MGPRWTCAENLAPPHWDSIPGPFYINSDLLSTVSLLPWRDFPQNFVRRTLKTPASNKLSGFRSVSNKCYFTLNTMFTL